MLGIKKKIDSWTILSCQSNCNCDCVYKKSWHMASIRNLCNAYFYTPDQKLSKSSFCYIYVKEYLSRRLVVTVKLQ